MLKLCSAAGLTLLLACLASAQQPVFEAASIRPAQQADLQGRWGEVYPAPMIGGPGTSSPGAITFRNASLLTVICAAYGMKRYQVSGPAWLQTAGFTIMAKAPAGATREDIQPMLRHLLEQRFHLALHREMRDIPVYELEIAKAGPKLSPSRDPDNGGGTFRTVQGNPSWQTTNQTVNGIAEFLSPVLDRPVIDSTGLTGHYDFTLYWAAEYPMARMGPPSGSSEPPEPAPTIFQALPDQLGLRLRAAKQQVAVLVIDAVDKSPTEN